MKNPPTTKRFFLRSFHRLSFCMMLMPIGLMNFPIAAQGQKKNQPSKGESGFRSTTFAFDVALQKVAMPLYQLQDQYENRLLSLKKTAEQGGNLELSLAIKEEIEKFRSGESPEATNARELKRYQTVYRVELSRRRDQFRKAIRPTLVAYHQKLSDLEKSLTAASKLEEGVKARDKKDQIKKMLESDLSRVSIDLGILDSGNDSISVMPITIIPRDKTADTKIGRLTRGVEPATNRSYKITEVPAIFKRWQFLRMEVQGDFRYNYKVEGKCLLYAMVHQDDMVRITGSTIDTEDWERTKYTIQASAKVFYVYQKVHQKGTYEMKSVNPWPFALMTKGKISIGE